MYAVFSLPLFVLHKSHLKHRFCKSQRITVARGVSVPMSAIYALYFIVMNIFSLSLFLTLLVNTTDPSLSRFPIVLVVLSISNFMVPFASTENHLARLGMHFHAVHARRDDFSRRLAERQRRIISCRFSMTAQTKPYRVLSSQRCSSLAEYAVLMPFLTNTDTKSGKSHRVLGFVVWNGGITVFLGVFLFFIVSCLGEYAALQVFPAYTLASIAEIAGIQRLDALFIGISMMALICVLPADYSA